MMFGEPIELSGNIFKKQKINANIPVMKAQSTTIRSVVLFCALLANAWAADSVGFVECSVTPAKQADSAKPGTPLFNMHIKLRSRLESAPFAFLRIAVDAKEAGKFETVEEKRIRRGTEVLEFDVPLYEWGPPKLSVLVLIQPKAPKAGETPLANSTKIVERPQTKQ